MNLEKLATEKFCSSLGFVKKVLLFSGLDAQGSQVLKIVCL